MIILNLKITTVVLRRFHVYVDKNGSDVLHYTAGYTVYLNVPPYLGVAVFSSISYF